MTLLQVFANKDLLELAVALSAEPSHEMWQKQELVPVAEASREDFLRVARSFQVLRKHAHCSECTETEPCVDDNALSEFVDGVVPEQKLAEVERKLAHCGACLNRAIYSARLANEIAPAPGLHEVVVGLVRRGLTFLSYPLQGFEAMELQPVAMMGDEFGTYSAKRWRQTQGQIEGLFTLATECNGLVSLHVRFLRSGAPAAGGRVALRNNDLLLESQLLPDSGEHVFLNLAPAKFAIELDDPAGDSVCFLICLQETV